MGVGVGVAVFALGEGTAVGSGVATGFDLELEARAVPEPVLLAEFELPFELPALRAEAVPGLLPEFEFPAPRTDGAVDRAAAFVFADAGAMPRWLVFEFRVEPVMLLERGGCRLAFDAIAALPPATVNTTSRWFARCSTRADAPGGSRNEITVLSPFRCTLTSANPRPRRASARGTSAAGILI